MLYEALLLFGVLAVAGLLFALFFQQRHALYLRTGLMVWSFVVLAVYFSWFWTHGGQTLAMKTWRIRLVGQDGTSVTLSRAAGRYLLTWMWFLPGLALAWAVGAKGWLLVLIPTANLTLWALTAYLDPQRQFLHDRLAGTRLIRLQPRVGKVKG